LIYGLTGNIGCGKSEVAKILATFSDVRIFDTDRIAKGIMIGHTDQIVSLLDSEILTCGHLDFGKIGKIVFTDQEKRRVLEEFVHPLVWERIREEIQKDASRSIFIVESAIIFEAGVEKRFDGVIAVVCSKDEQINRITFRNNLSLAEIETRIASQMSQAEKEARAQFVIYNNGTLRELKEQTLALYEVLKTQTPVN
jgi:dephospho-CoA kinase